MDSKRLFHKPVIIVGSPRSGTSLLQKLIRENPLFVSVARESDVIWNPYIHPSVNSWRQEGLVDRKLGEDDIASILNAYRNKALPATVWSRWSRSRIMESPFVSRNVRRIYPLADRMLTALRGIMPARQQALRLVDKSVHFGLWLPAIHQVFPNALFIHIARNGRNCVRSMINGWLEPDRFNTYLLPEYLRKDGAKYWCFPMPERWQEYLDMPLAERVAHQWVDIQTSIINGLQVARNEGRYLYVRLEDLTGEPVKTLRTIAEYIEEPYAGYFEQLSASIPVVNPTRMDYLSLHQHVTQHSQVIIDIISDIQIKLGYQM